MAYSVTHIAVRKSSKWLLLLWISLSAVCLADPSVTVASTLSPTSPTPTQTHTVKVGLADHKFQPDIVQAGVGDIVEFRFYPTCHSIVRAEYGLPCVPFEMTGSQKTGFFSGFKPVDKVLDDAPNYSIKINDTSPVFFYCSAPGSCINYGMVGAVNPNASTPIAKQQQLARDSTYMLNPGEPFPPESPLPSATSNYKPSSTPSPSSGENNATAGAIAGIVVSVVVGVVILGILIFLIYRRARVSRKKFENHDTTSTPQIQEVRPYSEIWSPEYAENPPFPSSAQRTSRPPLNPQELPNNEKVY